MARSALVLVVAVTLFGCGKPANYVEAPELPEPATIEESEPAEPMPAESEEAASESEDAEGGTEGTESEDASPPPAQKPCPELPRGTCEVTAGCVWSTTEKCIQE